ncbi:MAG: hypothetical protein M9894_02150 [Planctomycetes bacterium]|nr:hypothetical protein [Planctomycetota bacterium]
MPRPAPLLVALALVTPVAAADPPIAGEEHPAVRRLFSPAGLATLREAARCDLLAIVCEREPDPDEERLGDGEEEEAYPVRRRVPLEGEVRRAVLEALYADVAAGAMLAMCFEPHHAIVAGEGAARVEVVICYTCFRVQVRDAQGIRGAAIATASEPLLNRVLGQDRTVPADLLAGRPVEAWAARLRGDDRDAAEEAADALADALEYAPGPAPPPPEEAPVRARWAAARLDLSLDDATLEEAAAALARGADLPLEVAPSARTRAEEEGVSVTLRLREVSGQAALDLLLAFCDGLAARAVEGRLVLEARDGPPPRGRWPEVKEVEVRRRVVQALAAAPARLTTRAAWALGAAAGWDEDPEVRAGAARAVAALEGDLVHEAVQGAREALLAHDEAPPARRVGAARLLATLRASPGALEALMLAAEEDPDAGVRAAARQALLGR